MMNKKLLCNEGKMNAALENTLAVELFLNENYCFRRNVLNGKVEFAIKDDTADWRPLTQEALNSIVRRAKKEQVCEKGSPKTEIHEFVHSEDVRQYDPIGDFLTHLPAWDGQNRIGQLFSRLPGITSEQQALCFRKPKEGETGRLMSSTMLLNHIQKEYPSVEISHGNKVRVGQAMAVLGFESADHGNVPFYRVVPLKLKAA